MADGGRQRPIALMLCAATAWVAVHRLISGDFKYVVWSDRDLLRSSVPFWSLPTSGAEMSYGVGARIPGAAYHLLVWLAERLTHDPLGVWRVQVGLDALAALVLGAGVGRRFGWLAGSVAAAAFLSADPNAQTQQTLWNPAWMSLFVVVAVVSWIRVVADRDVRAIVVGVAAVVLAAQMHVTALLLLVALAPGLVLARLRGTLRPILWSVVAAVVLMSPYLYSELASGWVNTSMIFHSNQLADTSSLVSTDARPWASLRDAILALASMQDVQQVAQHVGRWAFAVGVLGPIAATLAILDTRDAGDPDHGKRRVVIAGLATAVAIELLLFARSRYFDFVTSNLNRYLSALVPVVAALLGVATASAVQVAGRVYRLAATAIALLIALSMAVRLGAIETWTTEDRYNTDSWASLSGWTHAVTGATGWTGPDLVGRVVVADRDGDHWAPLKATPIDALLAREGAHFEGSMSPPCGMVVATGAGSVQPALDDAALARALGPAIVAPVLDSLHPLGRGAWLAIYHPAVGRCPTTMSQRYVLTPPEEQLVANMHDVVPGTARRIESEAGVTQWIVVLDLTAGRDRPPRPLPILLERRDGPEGTTWSLHANALRGIAWNDGLFVNARIRRPRVVAQTADGPVEAVIAEGVVGMDGELTPLHTAGSTTPDHALSFSADVQPAHVDDAHTTDDTWVTLDVELP